MLVINFKIYKHILLQITTFSSKKPNQVIEKIYFSKEVLNEIKRFWEGKPPKKIIEIWKKRGYRLSRKILSTIYERQDDRIRRIIDGFCHRQI